MLVVASSHYFKQKQLGGNHALYPRPEGRDFTAHRITTKITPAAAGVLVNYYRLRLRAYICAPRGVDNLKRFLSVASIRSHAQKCQAQPKPGIQ